MKNGFSRINIKIRSKTETDINGEGPQIDSDDLKCLFTKLEILQNGDTVVLAGSIPSSLPQNMYEMIMSSQSGKDIRFVVDATGELLMNTLPYRTFLLKPNNHERGEILLVAIISPYETITYAATMKEKGDRNVLVSMGRC